MKMFKSRKVKIGLLTIAIIFILFVAFAAYKITHCGCKHSFYQREGVIICEK